METPKTPIIQFKDASILGGDRTILYNLKLDVYKGDFVYITGKVGCGKTSIIKTLIAQNPLGGGQIDIFGFYLSEIKRKDLHYLRRKIGVVFQDFKLLSDRSVHDNLQFVLESTGWKSEAKIEKRIKDVLTAVGMETKAHRMPHQLSGGEKQRIAIARAILNNAEIIMADEPTGNLDEQTAAEIMELFRGMNELGTAVIMVTHNLKLLRQYPGRVFECKNETCTEIYDY